MAKTNKNFWFLVGLLSVVLAGPNATIIKYSLGSIDPFLYNSLRFLLVALVTTPFLLKDSRRLNKKNLKLAATAGLYMAVAVTVFVWAIKLSGASYVSIVTLITPIILMIYSAKLVGEKVTYRALAGISLAALGAMVIVVLPVALAQSGSVHFKPLATVFALGNCLTFPLSIIYFKKANQAGIPMPSLMSISSWLVFVASALCLLIFGGVTTVVQHQAWFGIFYSGLVVALLARALSVVSYEHIGSAVIGSLFYVETFIAITLPLIFLHEKLSVELVAGGILILVGVYVVEYHKTVHHKHHHLFRSL
jgi:drug/metabolite transporter (DMT)-like permease